MRKPRVPSAHVNKKLAKNFPLVSWWRGLHKYWDYLLSWGQARQEEAQRQLGELEMPLRHRSWRRWLGKLGGSGGKKARKRRPRLQPSLEMLEDRRVPSQAYPYVQSINRTTPSGSTAAAGATFTVVFSEAVTGVSASDFSLAKTGSANTTTPVTVSGSGTTYTVQVAGITGTGSLGLNLVDNNSIHDSDGDPLVQGSGVACTPSRNDCR